MMPSSWVQTRSTVKNRSVTRFVGGGKAWRGMTLQPVLPAAKSQEIHLLTKISLTNTTSIEHRLTAF